jgi:hypothetical protein
MSLSRFLYLARAFSHPFSLSPNNIVPSRIGGTSVSVGRGVRRVDAGSIETVWTHRGSSGHRSAAVHSF